jgi:hypothetical protein
MITHHQAARPSAHFFCLSSIPAIVSFDNGPTPVHTPPISRYYLSLTHWTPPGKGPTSNQKKVYREIQAQPFVELCASGENFSWLRLNGKVVFSQDTAIKEKVQETSPLVKSIYQTPDNPEFEVFYLDEAVATISDFSGNPPQTFEL